MKKKIALFYVFFLYSTYNYGQTPPSIVTFFIRPMPNIQQPTIEKLQKKFATPGKLVNYAIQKEINAARIYSGVYVCYAGQVYATDINGQIFFSRVGLKKTFTMLITQDIKAIATKPGISTTILGFILDPKAHAQQYIFERIIDKETNTTQWNITQQDPILNKLIAYDTIILFADPKHVIVPLGKIATIEQGQNIILPDIYTTKNLSSALNALRFLKIRNFFKPVKMIYQAIAQGYQQRVVN